MTTVTGDDGLIRGDLEWGTIPNLLRSVAAAHPDREAVVDPSVDPSAESDDGVMRLSYAELADRAEATARALVAAGVEPGDRVAIWAPNIWEWPVTLLGLHLAGAVLVPLNTRYKGFEAAEILGRSGAKVLFTVEGFLGNDYVSMLADQELPDLERIVVLRGVVPAGSRAEHCDALLALDTEDRRAELSAEVDRRVEALSPDDLSDLLFTSGTTGAPKGVMCSHGQTLRAFADWSGIVGLRADDRYLIINPFFHAFGYKAGLVASLIRGCTMVLQAVFDVPQAMTTIEAERISMLPGPPTLYQTILNHPDLDATRLASLRLAVTGASVVPVALIEQMADVLGFETVLTAYGLTEATGVVSIARSDDDAETIATFSGRAIPGVELAVIDAAGAPLPAGEAGEVVVRGYNVMQGYFEAPDKTAEAIDAEGWLHTGDVGVLDERGYLRITDRLKDMFIVGGFNAYPAEIESLLCHHADVAQAAVVGVPDDRMGEIGYAFVVATVGTTPDPTEIRAWAKEHMANFKVPSAVEVVEVLPVNASGKVLRYELRDRAVASGGGS